MLRPQRVALKTDLKLSSRIIISDASFAISQPYNPIQKPTSACLRASKSFRLSPVTATVDPTDCSAMMKANFCSGVHLANTLHL